MHENGVLFLVFILKWLNDLTENILYFVTLKKKKKVNHSLHDYANNRQNISTYKPTLMNVLIRRSI